MSKDHEMVEGCQPCFFVVHCMVNDFEISAFLFRAVLAFLSVLAVFIDGMTVCASTTESSVHDVAALMKQPTLHSTASRFQARRLRATREVCKARGSPRR